MTRIAAAALQTLALPETRRPARLVEAQVRTAAPSKPAAKTVAAPAQTLNAAALGALLGAQEHAQTAAPKAVAHLGAAIEHVQSHPHGKPPPPPAPPPPSPPPVTPPPVTPPPVPPPPVVPNGSDLAARAKADIEKYFKESAALTQARRARELAAAQSRAQHTVTEGKAALLILQEISASLHDFTVGFGRHHGYGHHHRFD